MNKIITSDGRTFYRRSCDEAKRLADLLAADTRAAVTVEFDNGGRYRAATVDGGPCGALTLPPRPQRLAP